jgi:hypothetical protein
VGNRLLADASSVLSTVAVTPSHAIDPKTNAAGSPMQIEVFSERRFPLRLTAKPGCVRLVLAVLEKLMSSICSFIFHRAHPVRDCQMRGNRR